MVAPAKHQWRQQYRTMRRGAEKIHNTCYGHHAPLCGVIENLLGAMVDHVDLAATLHDDEMQEVCGCHIVKTWQAFFSAYQLLTRGLVSESLDLLRLGLETAWQNKYLHLHREKIADWAQGKKIPAAEARKALDGSDLRHFHYDKLSELSHPRYKSFDAFRSYFENDNGDDMAMIDLPAQYDQERLRHLLVRFAYYLNWPILEFVNDHSVPAEHPWAVQYQPLYDQWATIMEAEIRSSTSHPTA